MAETKALTDPDVHSPLTSRLKTSHVDTPSLIVFPSPPTWPSPPHIWRGCPCLFQEGWVFLSYLMSPWVVALDTVHADPGYCHPVRLSSLLSFDVIFLLSTHIHTRLDHPAPRCQSEISHDSSQILIYFALQTQDNSRPLSRTSSFTQYLVIKCLIYTKLRGRQWW